MEDGNQFGADGMFIRYIVIWVDGISFPHCESLYLETPNYLCRKS